MFRALLAHPLEALHRLHLGYIACVVYQLAAPGLEFHSNPGATPPEDEQVMLETCRSP
jgi:hypothetical protein